MLVVLSNTGSWDGDQLGVVALCENVQTFKGVVEAYDDEHKFKALDETEVAAFLEENQMTMWSEGKAIAGMWYQDEVFVVVDLDR